MRTWIFQDHRQVEKVGESAASWYVGWYDPAGKKRSKSCGAGTPGRKAAEKEAEKISARLIAGTYEDNTRATWADFRKEYEEQALSVMEPRTREESLYALNHFERLIRPAKMHGITVRTVATYVAKRRQEEKSPGNRISPATVNKELRHVRAALKKAYRWGFLGKAVDFDGCFLREPKRLPTYVTPEHFRKLYDACPRAKYPDPAPFPAADWWRGLLMFAYLTGWRIGAILALRWEDTDLDGGWALSRAADNKGKRDQKVPLHPTLVDHLRRIASFDPCVFPFNNGRATLFREFLRLQAIAEVKPEGPKPHYGFHDLRRAFATMNADRLTPDMLQLLMQHRDYQTTQRYINMARQVNPAVQNLFVPDVGKADAAG